MEKSKYILLILLFTVSIFVRCSNGSVELNKTVIDDICYEATVLPKEILEKDDTIKIADLMYLKFTIYETQNNARIQEVFKQANYNNFLYYVNTKIISDFKIIQDDKETAPIQIYFENNNRISNKLVFLIAFEKQISSKNTLLKFNDNIFNKGIVKLQLNKI